MCSGPMVRHFAGIASASGAPVTIYNVVPWSYLQSRLLLRIVERYRSETERK